MKGILVAIRSSIIKVLGIINYAYIYIRIYIYIYILVYIHVYIFIMSEIINDGGKIKHILLHDRYCSVERVSTNLEKF